MADLGCQFFAAMIRRSLNHQRFLTFIDRECPSYCDYNFTLDKESPEAKAALQKVQMLYSEVANSPQDVEFISAHCLNQVFNDTYLEHLQDIAQQSGHPLFVESWTDRSIVDGYYDALEANLRKKITMLPVVEGEDPNVKAGLQSGLRNAAARVGWLNVLDEALPVRMPLPSPDFIREFSTFLSKKANIIAKVCCSSTRVLLVSENTSFQVLLSFDPLLSFESMYQSYRTYAGGWVGMMSTRGRVPKQELEFLIVDVSAFDPFIPHRRQPLNMPISPSSSQLYFSTSFKGVSL